MPNLSVIIPCYNEEGAVVSLYKKLRQWFSNQSRAYEIVFVNDGSKDGTALILDELAQKDPYVKVIHFVRNYGQTAAIMAGIDEALGDVLILMDGDGQNDPSDIGKLLSKIDEGYDVISGWRQDRQDKTISRKIPSWLANKLISWVSGIRLHDYGCSLKAYKKECIKGVNLYGEMHRFIPIYASWLGAKVAEIPVSHHARTTGVSKYGINRTLKVMLDLMVVKFFHGYMTKPIYVMGGFGFIAMGLSFVSFIYATYLKFGCGTSYILTPLPLFSAISFLVGILSILIGLLSEVLMRTYYESQNKKPYVVGRVVSGEKPCQ